MTNTIGSSDEALDLMATFIATFAQFDEKGTNSVGLMYSLLERFGSSAVIAAASLKELGLQGQYSDLFAFPGQSCDLSPDPVVCLMKEIADLAGSSDVAWDAPADQDPGNMKLMMLYLAAAAYQAQSSAGDPQQEAEYLAGLEGIARVTLLVQELIPELKRAGWTQFNFVSSIQGGTGFGFFAWKDLSQEPGMEGLSTSFVGLIEPLLQESDVQDVLAAIDDAINYLTQSVPSTLRSTWPFVAIILYKVESQAALDALCASLPEDGLPVVVMYPDGTIPCYAGTDETGALQFCAWMGRTNCNFRERFLPPDRLASESASAVLANANTTPASTCNRNVLCLLE
jgi:hypothetical protein